MSKFARKERLDPDAFCGVARAVIRGELGSGEADHGGGLFKKRVARDGRGKSGGYRMVVGFRAPKANRVLFVYAFSKNDASSLTPTARKL